MFMWVNFYRADTLKSMFTFFGGKTTKYVSEIFAKFILMDQKLKVKLKVNMLSQCTVV